MSMPSLDTFKRQLRERLPEFPEPHLVTVAKLVNDAVGEASHRHGIWAGDVSTAVAEVVKYLNVADTRPAPKAAASDAHLFYTQFGADGKPAPGAGAVPLSLIVTVTTLYRRTHPENMRLMFEVVGKDFNWSCRGASDMVTESMYRDLMERWGALHKTEPAPAQSVDEIDDGDVMSRGTFAKLVAACGLPAAMEHLHKARGERSKAQAERDQLQTHLSLAISTRDLMQIERDQIRAAHEDLHRYIRDIFEQETDEKEDEHRNDTKFERNAALDQVRELKDQLDPLRAPPSALLRVAVDQLRTERDRLQADRDQARTDLNQARADLTRELQAKVAAQDKLRLVADERNQLKAERDQLQVDLGFMRTILAEVRETRTGAWEQINQLKADRDKALEQVRQMEIERDQIDGIAGSDAKAEIAQLRREIHYLRTYGDNECTAMADAAMPRSQDMNDADFLRWIHERLVKVHGENPLYDYMHRFRAIIMSLPPERLTESANSGNYPPKTTPPSADDDLRKLWRDHGGSFHGPNVETGTMPEAALLPLLRKLLSGLPKS
jgi:hypothetical protein